MRVAIVHDWLTGMRGGERCLEAFCELLPEADIYTLLHSPGSVSSIIEAHRIHTSFIQRLPFALTRYRHFLPLFPLAIDRFELTGTDLILSSSHCVAKNVRVPEGALHISYIHTPMRYVWDQYDAYFGRGRASLPVRIGMRVVRPWLQKTDVSTSRSVHSYVANSKHVAERIRRYYKRSATVIYPPVDVERFEVSEHDEGYYLMVTAFAPYKRVDLAIETFNRLGWPLRIIGSGQDEKRLKRLSRPNIEFLGWKSDSEVQEAYSRCRALVFPGEEDFGIVPLEAMACGKPVIAYAKGGALETVVPIDGFGRDRPERYRDDATGVLFASQTPESLTEAVRRLERTRSRFDPHKIRAHAEQFSTQRFKTAISNLIAEKCKAHFG